MDHRTVAWDGVLESGDSLEYEQTSRWGAFFRSWKWACVLAAACVAGLIAIVSANPFASGTVSERVSAKLRQPTSCTEVGAARVGDVQSKIYKCTVGLRTNGFQCFAISGSDIRQIGGRRELGC